MRQTFKIEVELDVDISALATRMPTPEEVANVVRIALADRHRHFGRNIDLLGVRANTKGK